jgi:hypothetical protein
VRIEDRHRPRRRQAFNVGGRDKIGDSDEPGTGDGGPGPDAKPANFDAISDRRWRCDPDRRTTSLGNHLIVSDKVGRDRAAWTRDRAGQAAQRQIGFSGAGWASQQDGAPAHGDRRRMHQGSIRRDHPVRRP